MTIIEISILLICIKHFLIEIRCKGLTTSSVQANCLYNDEWVACETPVLPRTTARLMCKNSYRLDTTRLSTRRKNVRCDENGQWVPEPIQCIPGPIAINIYLNNTLTLQTTLQTNNATLIEILNDKIIIHTNIEDLYHSNIDIKIPTANNNLVTEEPWLWS